MSRLKQLLLIYVLTILGGTILSALLISTSDLFVLTVKYGLQRSLMYSTPAILVSLIAHFRIDHMDDYQYFRMMMRVLLGVLVATYIGLLAAGFVDIEDYDLQRVYLIYSTIAVALTFLLLQAKKK